MYDVLNCSLECSLVTSPAAALIVFQMPARDLAFPFPKSRAHEAEPVILALVRGADRARAGGLLSCPLPSVLARVIAFHDVPQIQIPPGLGHNSGGPQLNSASIN